MGIRIPVRHLKLVNPLKLVPFQVSPIHHLKHSLHAFTSLFWLEQRRPNDSRNPMLMPRIWSDTISFIICLMAITTTFHLSLLDYGR